MNELLQIILTLFTFLCICFPEIAPNEVRFNQSMSSDMKVPSFPCPHNCFRVFNAIDVCSHDIFSLLCVNKGGSALFHSNFYL